MDMQYAGNQGMLFSGVPYQFDQGVREWDFSPGSFLV